jgi:hypothetical protein
MFLLARRTYPAANRLNKGNDPSHSMRMPCSSGYESGRLPNAGGLRHERCGNSAGPVAAAHHESGLRRYWTRRCLHRSERRRRKLKRGQKKPGQAGALVIAPGPRTLLLQRNSPDPTAHRRRRTGVLADVLDRLLTDLEGPTGRGRWSSARNGPRTTEARNRREGSSMHGIKEAYEPQPRSLRSTDGSFSRGSDGVLRSRLPALAHLAPGAALSWTADATVRAFHLDLLDRAGDADRRCWRRQRLGSVRARHGGRSPHQNQSNKRKQELGHCSILVDFFSCLRAYEARISSGIGTITQANGEDTCNRS